MRKALGLLAGGVIYGLGVGVGKVFGEEIGESLKEFGKSVMFPEDGGDADGTDGDSGDN